MIYVNFEEHITRKHGVIIKGWPLKTFESPSSVGSTVELSTLLHSWEQNATKFYKMSDDKYMVWIAGRTERLPNPGPIINQPPTTFPENQVANNEPGPSFIHFTPPAAPPMVINLTNGAVPKKARKTRSDKGRPRKKVSQTIPGTNTFSAGTL